MNIALKLFLALAIKILQEHGADMLEKVIDYLESRSEGVTATVDLPEDVRAACDEILNQ